MAFNVLTRATLMVAILGVTACTANINATTPGVNLGGGGGETAKAAIQVSESDPEVAKLDLGDLTPYRIECPDPDAANKSWIIFYYSAKTNKSYRCNTKVGQKVEFIEVTDGENQYRQGAEIDETKWKIDSEQAKTNAVKVVQNVNITQIRVTNLVLLSAAEFTRRTGTPSQDPVWVCTVDPGPSASPSPTASPSPMPTASPSTSPSPSPEPTATPSAVPSPTGGTTIVNNITNVYINANNGNQIAVNTGTQTNTETNTR